ncbi:hypothetical protein A2982_01850 [candidate division WWE3 bacterium RIFCSPLOWO2_01_FULL_39_13]|uniref:DUF2304 domain-containing protein n=1 Tax=candidate division WWE3 bacterium RIFCSPLOWO2_01_FULL_39_13 TaxID=1802624 RepID=A0A1F4V226_UNCKA|nr:MAG: hypothetical protein A2982_01850 [candidate division WWE3 bacterium RIFCSPLOWO2_01_FULL_39_13]
MILFQIIFIVFIIFSAVKVVGQIRNNKIGGFNLIFWLLIWIAGGIVILAPEISSNIGTFFGIGRGADLIIYSSIIVLFYIVYRIYIKVESMDKKIKELATKTALGEKTITKN